MPNAAALAALEKEIADVRENIRDLTEQAAAYSGAEDDALSADRIAEQEALLARLQKNATRSRAELRLAGDLQPAQIGRWPCGCRDRRLQRLDVVVRARLPAARACVGMAMDGCHLFVNRADSHGGKTEHRHGPQPRRLHDIAEGAKHRLPHFLARRFLFALAVVLVPHGVLRRRISIASERRGPGIYPQAYDFI